LFVNGLPVATFELKNNLTCQNVRHAIEQYKTDRDPREPLFAFARCLVHFAVDEQEVSFCTHLQGKASEFLPFNQGSASGGAGRQPTQPHRSGHGLPLAADPHPRQPYRHPGELRPGGAKEESPHCSQNLQADLSPLPPARCGALVAG
jgi:hypothetical protein